MSGSFDKDDRVEAPFENTQRKSGFGVLNDFILD